MFWMYTIRSSNSPPDAIFLMSSSSMMEGSSSSSSFFARSRSSRPNAASQAMLYTYPAYRWS